MTEQKQIPITYALNLAIQIFENQEYIKSGQPDSNVTRLRQAMEVKAESEPTKWETVDTLLNWRHILHKNSVSSEYYMKIVEILGNEYGIVEEKNLGILASIPYAYAKWKQGVAKAEAMKAEFENREATGRFVGLVGERSEFRGRINSIRWFDSIYGKTAMVQFETDEGDTLIAWISHNASFWDGDPFTGCRVTFKATVAEHSVFKGQRQTKVKRVKRTDGQEFTFAEEQNMEN